MADLSCGVENCKFENSGKCVAPAVQTGDTKAATGNCATCAHFELQKKC